MARHHSPSIWRRAGAHLAALLRWTRKAHVASAGVACLIVAEHLAHGAARTWWECVLIVAASQGVYWTPNGPAPSWARRTDTGAP